MGNRQPKNKACTNDGTLWSGKVAWWPFCFRLYFCQWKSRSQNPRGSCWRNRTGIRSPSFAAQTGRI